MAKSLNPRIYRLDTRFHILETFSIYLPVLGRSLSSMTRHFGELLLLSPWAAANPSVILQAVKSILTSLYMLCHYTAGKGVHCVYAKKWQTDQAGKYRLTAIPSLLQRRQAFANCRKWKTFQRTQNIIRFKPPGDHNTLWCDLLPTVRMPKH